MYDLDFNFTFDRDDCRRKGNFPIRYVSLNGNISPESHGQLEEDHSNALYMTHE